MRGMEKLCETVMAILGSRRSPACGALKPNAPQVPRRTAELIPNQLNSQHLQRYTGSRSARFSDLVTGAAGTGAPLETVYAGSAEVTCRMTSARVAPNRQRR